MGDLFDGGGLSSESTLDDIQHTLLAPLRDFAKKRLTASSDQNLDTLTAALMGSTSGKAIGLAKDVWKQGFLDPVLNSFDTSIAPRINNQFARIGGTLSSRRTKDLGDTLGNLTAQASGQFAQMLPTIMNYPLQQTLGQIQGLGGLRSLEFQPYDKALQFALQGTRSVAQEPQGAGFGLINSGLGVLGFGLGGGFGGGGGGGGFMPTSSGLNAAYNPASSGYYGQPAGAFGF